MRKTTLENKIKSVEDSGLLNGADIVIQTDGGGDCSNNGVSRGGNCASAFVVIKHPNLNAVSGKVHIDKNKTNNELEYKGLVMALEFILENLLAKNPAFKDKSFKILCDSQLIVRQVNREYACKAANLTKLYQDSLRLLFLIRTSNKIEVEWMKRTYNVADDACRIYIGGKVDSLVEFKDIFEGLSNAKA